MKFHIQLILLLLTLGANGQEILWDSTFVVDQVEFQVLACRNEYGSYAQLVKAQKDTLIIDGVNGRIHILDFNNDNFVDITFSYYGNNSTADLFLYDSKSKNYLQVVGFNEVSDLKRLTSDTNYYHSYSRAGCADMNWVSTLFYIQNFKVCQIGKIYGEGCLSEGSKREIKIGKIVTLDKTVQIETLPIDTICAYKDSKWGFIREYWNNNLEKFKNIKAP